MIKLVKPSSQYLSSAIASCQEYVSDKNAFQIIHPVMHMIENLQKNPARQLKIVRRLIV